MHSSPDREQHRVIGERGIHPSAQVGRGGQAQPRFVGSRRQRRARLEHRGGNRPVCRGALAPGTGDRALQKVRPQHQAVEPDTRAAASRAWQGKVLGTRPSRSARIAARTSTTARGDRSDAGNRSCSGGGGAAAGGGPSPGSPPSIHRSTSCTAVTTDRPSASAWCTARATTDPSVPSSGTSRHRTSGLGAGANGRSRSAATSSASPFPAAPRPAGSPRVPRREPARSRPRRRAAEHGVAVLDRP